MKNKFLDHFRLSEEKEDFENIALNINNGVSFKGTNLWILIFAIFIASLGLNINSTAVIIGAMLISPLMGPIMGLGFSLAINDLLLLRKSIQNLVYEIVIGLTASTVYFLVTPLYEAHSELLARTSPNIYDVLIAIFGGLAGILATSSKQKGNVLPGVAIATALMPPLCTAGYGLATQNWYFFFGAFYLFIINTVFITVATLVTIRLLKFPHKQLADTRAEKKAQRIIALIILATILPSIYLSYIFIKQDRFKQKANQFIDTSCKLPNDYLLNKDVNVKTHTITLTYGGKKISIDEINELKNRLKYAGLADASLLVHQGFAYLNENNINNSQLNELSKTLGEREYELNSLKTELDSIHNQNQVSKQLFAELKIQYPELNNAIVSSSSYIVNDSLHPESIPLVVLFFKRNISLKEKDKISAWLKVRLKDNNVKSVFE